MSEKNGEWSPVIYPLSILALCKTRVLALAVTGGMALWFKPFP